MRRRRITVLYIRRLRRYGRVRKRIEDSREAFRQRIRRWKRRAAEQEIFSSCVLLKNLAIVRKNIPMSGDYMLEQLMENSYLLKPVYHEILFRLRSGAGSAAFDAMTEQIDTRSASAFAMILGKLEQINPAELVTAMESFEETFRGERVTRAMRRTNVKSLLTTVCAMTAIFAILMNFVVVVVFMDMFAMLGQISGM